MDNPDTGFLLCASVKRQESFVHAGYVHRCSLVRDEPKQAWLAPTQEELKQITSQFYSNLPQHLVFKAVGGE